MGQLLYHTNHTQVLCLLHFSYGKEKILYKKHTLPGILCRSEYDIRDRQTHMSLSICTLPYTIKQIERNQAKKHYSLYNNRVFLVAPS